MCCYNGNDKPVKPIEASGIQICKDVDEDGFGVDCRSRFDYGIDKIYVVIDYISYGTEKPIDVKWYKDGEYYFSDTFPYEEEEYGDDYYIYTSIPLESYRTLPSGSYQVKVFQDDVLITSSAFKIE